MTEGLEYKRLFIAIDLPGSLKKELVKQQNQLPGFKWASINQLHLTLRFLGNVSISNIKLLCDSLENINDKPFKMHVFGTGFFPNAKRPSVFWLGLDSTAQLSNLKNKIDKVLLQILNFEPEKRDFVPHITLLRFRRPPRKSVIQQIIEHFAKFPAQEVAVSRFYLYSSELSQHGATHKIEQEFVL
ncbi:MAG: RNA 2',3'-cyclic phosphodiesterase [Lentisphaerae bacterium]|nr:RNA 2',3'-cyclic phosphodiesterase [Lentisphaerota bacterium]MCP4102655.1 RNA 2',3'-cyclic phosphodiesterase [Lentisphaerota bacterium]